MAHSVEVNITSHPLSREENGIVFVVADDEGKFGELTISKGGVRWRPREQAPAALHDLGRVRPVDARGAQGLRVRTPSP